ncbi:unnamed protein product [Arctogadus glacialis]
MFPVVWPRPPYTPPHPRPSGDMMCRDRTMLHLKTTWPALVKRRPPRWPTLRLGQKKHELRRPHLSRKQTYSG